MTLPFCKTPRRRENARSSAPSFSAASNQEKVQRAVLFLPFVEARLRNVSMLTFVRRRNGSVQEEVPVAYPKAICLEVQDHNLQRAEDRACKTWRERGEDAITCARRTLLNTRFRYVSRLTWCIDPGRPRVQRLNISRGSNELVQDRCAGDNV